MFSEGNTKTNLPAQIEMYADKGDKYKLLYVVKGGGSANKTYLYQQTKVDRLRHTCVLCYAGRHLDRINSAN